MTEMTSDEMNLMLMRRRCDIELQSSLVVLPLDSARMFLVARSSLRHEMSAQIATASFLGSLTTFYPTALSLFRAIIYGFFVLRSNLV